MGLVGFGSYIFEVCHEENQERDDGKVLNLIIVQWVMRIWTRWHWLREGSTARFWRLVCGFIRREIDGKLARHWVKHLQLRSCHRVRQPERSTMRTCAWRRLTSP